MEQLLETSLPAMPCASCLENIRVSLDPASACRFRAYYCEQNQAGAVFSIVDGGAHLWRTYSPITGSAFAGFVSIMKNENERLLKLLEPKH